MRGLRRTVGPRVIRASTALKLATDILRSLGQPADDLTVRLVASLIVEAVAKNVRVTTPYSTGENNADRNQVVD